MSYFHQCPKCKRKYKRESKLEEHVNSTHPYTTFLSNEIGITDVESLYLLDQMYYYIEVVDAVNDFDASDIENGILQYIQWDGKQQISQVAVFVWCSHMLLPQSYKEITKIVSRPNELGEWFRQSTKEIENQPDDYSYLNDDQIEELKRITQNHIVFCKRVKSSTLIHKIFDNNLQVYDLFAEFNRFMNLGLTWKKDNFCPSLIIDFIWHSSMMNPGKYEAMCRRFIGTLLPHCLDENEGRHTERYELFVKQYEFRFKCKPLQIETLSPDLSKWDTQRDGPIDLQHSFDRECKENIYPHIIKCTKQRMKEFEEQKLKEAQEREEKRRALESKQREEAQKRREENMRLQRLIQPEPFSNPNELYNQLRNRQDNRPYTRPSWDDGKC